MQSSAWGVLFVAAWSGTAQQSIEAMMTTRFMNLPWVAAALARLAEL
jgi:hypothetical protein